jgi:glycosyltransferase involved in cell wall biosynthesis
LKVLIVTNAAPFIWGGAEELALNLSKQLNLLKGVESEILRIPFQWEPKERLPVEVMLNQNFSIVNTDRVIALKFPAYHVQHERKTLWLLHQFRQAYDLMDAGQSYLEPKADSDIIEAVVRSDNQCFNQAHKIYTNSPVTQGRLKHYNQHESEVLYPPLNDEELFVPGDYGNYIFAGGRVTKGKRQHLLIEAMRFAGPNSKLVIAGPPSDEAYADRLRKLVEKYDLGSRVTLQLAMHERTEIANLAKNALACAYIPFDEDSLGYVTMEAFASGKAVVTTTDSGGLLEIVKDNETGFVCEPEAKALGNAFACLCDAPERARKLGKSSLDLWKSRQINWAHTLDKLLK